MHEPYGNTREHRPSASLADAAAHFRIPADTLYLDCAAQGPRLHAVLAAGHAALDATTAPWTLSFESWQAQIEALRSLAADTLFNGDVEGLAMVPSVAFAIATAARNARLHAGDIVLVLEGEFPSNLLPWQQRCAEADAHVVAVHRGAGQDWADAVLAALRARPNVRVVALPQAHWHDGGWVDLDRITPAVHALDAVLVLDLSQSLGALPLKLDAWRPDFVASVGHKWLLGPTGLAWLWVSPRWREGGVPIEQHWSARDAGDQWNFPASAAPPLRAGARRFDAGGVTDPPRLAMAHAALAQVQAWGVGNIATQLAAITGALDHALEAHGLREWQTAGHAPHFTALRAPSDIALAAVAGALHAERIVCTLRAGLLRIAPHVHASDDDMRRVAEVVARSGHF